MKTLKSVDLIDTKEEARGIAIDWQAWASEQTLSYEELSVYASYFEKLASKFKLINEFKENGII